MADTKGRYPLSTADGTYIPLDVIRPNSAVPIAFVTSAGSASLSVPATVEFFSVKSDQDCYIQFAASAAAAAALVDNTIKTDAVIIPANVLVVVSAPIDKKSMSIRGLTLAGTALLNFLESWTGLATSSQSTRR